MPSSLTNAHRSVVAVGAGVFSMDTTPSANWFDPVAVFSALFTPPVLDCSLTMAVSVLSVARAGSSAPCDGPVAQGLLRKRMLEADWVPEVGTRRTRLTMDPAGPPK